MPGPEQRQAFVEWYLGLEEYGKFTWPDSLTPQMLANITASLSLVHLEDILLRAEAEGALRPEMVRERNEAIIRSEYGDVLEVMEHGHRSAPSRPHRGGYCQGRRTG